MILAKNRKSRSAPSFSLLDRVYRLLWSVVWLVFFRTSPVFFKKWRVFLLNFFGAKVDYTANIYPRVKVWSPRNLIIKNHSCVANDVYLYNQDVMILGSNSLISQGAYLCCGSHDYNSKLFDLITKPIVIQNHVWVASGAFIGPGVQLSDGCVVAAMSVVVKDVAAYHIVGGNPAKFIKQRNQQELWK